MDETPQQPPEILSAHEKRSGCLPKALGLLVLISAVVAAVVYIGGGFLKSRLMKPKPEVVEVPPAPEVVETPPTPPALDLARQLLAAPHENQLLLASQMAASEGSKLEAISFLSDSFAAADADTKKSIAVTFGLLAKNTPEARSALIPALADTASRREAIVAAGSLGPDGAFALDELKKIAADKNLKPAVRTAARNSINQILGIKTPAAKAKPKPKGKTPTKKRKKK